MSVTVMPSFASLSGCTQSRIAYCPAPKTCVWPTPYKARDGVVEIDIGVVAEESRVECALRGKYADQHEGSGHGLSNGHPVGVNVRRELAGSQLLARLREDEIEVRVRLQVEVHHHGGLRVTRGVQRVHVVHVVHAVDLLFDGRGDGLLQGLRVRADIGGLQLNFRWNDVRKLRHGQACDGDRAHNHHKDGDHHRDDRTVDEELRHSSVSFPGKMYGLGSNDSSFLDLLQSFDYNLLTRLEAIINNPHRPDRLAGLHGAHTNSVIVADNRHLIGSLRLRNGALRKQQSALFHVGFDTRSSILAGTQNVAGIGKGSNDANRTRAWIHLPVRQQDFAFLRVGTAVSQDQFERVSEKTDSVSAGNGITLLYEDILMFANREISFDGIHLRN